MLVINGPTDDSGHQDPGHPERPDRVTAVMAGIADLHLGTDLVVAPEYSATRAELTRVHEGGYLDELDMFCYEGGGDLDEDTYATYKSWSIARFAAGAGIAAVDTLRQYNDGVAFVVTRPPGHHALRDRAMGFCLLNNIAVTAAKLTSEGERVLILDWDVHHGNGTQSIFWNDPSVMYVSTHQWPLFPGSGAPREIGGLDAMGLTLNIPLPPGATGDVMRQAIDEAATPLIDEFGPTWVLVSAGFDAHRDDPMADLELTSGDFAELGRMASGFAPQPGRLALFLEGGYDLAALQGSVTATLSAMLGGEYQSETASSGGPGSEMVLRSRAERVLALRQAEEVITNQDRVI
jgi:acetoin utilization deacetylase AcuC-like enzyme